MALFPTFVLFFIVDHKVLLDITVCWWYCFFLDSICLGFTQRAGLQAARFLLNNIKHNWNLGEPVISGKFQRSQSFSNWNTFVCFSMLGNKTFYRSQMAFQGPELLSNRTLDGFLSLPDLPLCLMLGFDYRWWRTFGGVTHHFLARRPPLRSGWGMCSNKVILFFFQSNGLLVV